MGNRKESIMKQSAKIYSFDFDGTIVQNKYPEIGEPISEVIRFIQRVKADGNYIILNTMREGKYLNQAVDYCRDNGIVFDAVNDNLPHMKDYFKNNPRKIFANYYIDDHNLFMPKINGLTSEDYNEQYNAITRRLS